MYNFFKKEKFSSSIFVIASISAFIIIFLSGVFLNLNQIIYFNKVQKVEKNLDGTYYLNENFRQDPFITRNPQLRDMLRGPIITNLDPSIGNYEAVVNIVYFSDFKCDYCRDQEKVLNKIIEKYKDNVRIIWKDYPDSKITSEQYRASLAGRCAQDQDKFWEYHDLLFENNNSLSKGIFLSLAKQLNLDVSEFEKCLDEERGRTRIRDNILEANALDITGIPFVYVNDQEIFGTINFEDLEKIIEIELKQNEEKS
ncbi:thioredoxin domain-containing protein [Candidatus Parcubacteria bacterium]|nr:thioredoxin domain-containing protein [Candidatus Parcubacteria bacterium]